MEVEANKRMEMEGYATGNDRNNGTRVLSCNAKKEIREGWIMHSASYGVVFVLNLSTL